jgi:hypothetical protein
MATTAKSNPKPKAKTAVNSLEGVYLELENLLKQHAPPFRADVACMSGGKKSFQLTVPKKVVVPGACGGKPLDLMMAAVILQKDFVGFYLHYIYMNDELKKQVSPSLLKLLKGKTCFHVKELDDGLRKDITAALELGTKVYRARGWM